MSNPKGSACLHAAPRETRQREPWSSGGGFTEVIRREPDNADWNIRVSIARVERDGPFSELEKTRRILVPLDAAMTLRFSDGRELSAARFDVLRFDGSPAPFGALPEGPTRDFNLMLRGDARGEMLARTLVDSMVLLHETDVRWLIFVNRGHASVSVGEESLTLESDDAAWIDFAVEPSPNRTVIEGAGEIVLVKLYA
ncbi:MAG: HutD family protein [Rhodanobacteraceae bacterium]